MSSEQFVIRVRKDDGHNETIYYSGPERNKARRFTRSAGVKEVKRLTGLFGATTSYTLEPAGT